MQLVIRYFAIFREATGVSREVVESSAGNAQELFREAMARHPGLAHEPAALVAINDAMAGWDATLKDDDEVLFFPPVAGG
jgi:molybdopterin converting factor small subunit